MRLYILAVIGCCIALLAPSAAWAAPEAPPGPDAAARVVELTNADDPLDEQIEELGDRGVHLEPVGNGVSRVSWTSTLQQQGFETAAAAVHEEVTIAIEQ